MIVAEQKPFDEIYELIKGCEKVLVLGCGTCVTVCMSGGEKEVGILASTIRLANKASSAQMDVRECTIERQCDREHLRRRDQEDRAFRGTDGEADSGGG